MKLSQLLIRFFRNWLPSPFALALLLSGVTFILAWLLTSPTKGGEGYPIELVGHWANGFWGLLEFGGQMMLMLVLGHVLALTPAVNKLIGYALVGCKDARTTALVVTLVTVAMSLINWGLGLIAGAILARKAGEKAARELISIPYPLIGAAGYSGLMVWHGGLSGNAPLKAAEVGHKFANLTDGPVPVTETLFSPMNITLTVVLFVGLPLLMYFLAGIAPSQVPRLRDGAEARPPVKESAQTPAERIDHSRIFSVLVGCMVLVAAIYKAILEPDELTMAFLNPNWINFMLLGFGLILHKHLMSFLAAVQEAIGGASGILIQFPIYAGIMGIMVGSGLADVFSNFFVEISSGNSFFILTLVSAGIVNFFVPSGGGQWAVQGGVVMTAANELGLSHGKAIMALSYGDQLTNMMQPFWALPLLGITGLKAQEILPWTMVLMAAGFVLFAGALLIF